MRQTFDVRNNTMGFLLFRGTTPKRGPAGVKRFFIWRTRDGNGTSLHSVKIRNGFILIYQYIFVNDCGAKKYGLQKTGLRAQDDRRVKNAVKNSHRSVI